jgi:hypothetical protein
MDLLKPEIPQTPFDIYELLSTILSFLPRSVVDLFFDPASDSNLLCSRVCGNWHSVSRIFAFWSIELKTEEEARRFLATLLANEAYVERNPGWPLINSTLVLGLDGDVGGLF